MVELPNFMRKAKGLDESKPAPEPVAPTQKKVVGSALMQAIAEARARREAEENAAKRIEAAKEEPLVRLFYHPESESYWTADPQYPGDFDRGIEPDMGDGMSHEVTDSPDAWAAFYAQEQIRAEAELNVTHIPESALEIVAQLPALPDADPVEPSMGITVHEDHLRRAALQAAVLFNIMEGMSVKLDPSQVAAVHGMVKEQYACLIGAAGTGKTTTTRVLLHTLMNGDAEAGIDPIRIETVDMSTYRPKVSILDDEDAEDIEDQEDAMVRAGTTRIPAIALCAYTGQATQVLRGNLPPAWRANAMTIHSLLAYVPVPYTKPDGKPGMRFEPTYTSEYRLPWDVIMIDEGSMVNLDLWGKLLAACKPGCRIYIIGDLNQLPPPVGMGVLGFALAKWKVFQLTVVHRQSDESANRIIDTAHAVLNGRYDDIKFDDPQTNKNWRVIGFEIAKDQETAHRQIVNIAKALSEKRVSEDVNPERPLVYDPFRDRIMTPGNGYNPDEPGSMLGQSQINDTLSRLFTDEGVTRYIIDCQRVVKKFAVGYRVMATKNEPSDTVNRVTNGLTGKIMKIIPNAQWKGDRRLVGDERIVAENRKHMVTEALRQNVDQGYMNRAEALNASLSGKSIEDVIKGLSDAAAAKGATMTEEKLSGPASHIVTVRFDNGATREFSLNAEVEQLMLAYASTVHKTQGAEMPTAIIVVHDANKFHLNRESLYTAVTRAKERVIFLYTQYGFRYALSKQKVSGRDLGEKIANYLKLMGGEDGEGFKTVKVRLTEND